MPEPEDKTPVKRPNAPFEGAKSGKPFTAENQPSVELKKKGWEKWRAERHLTQEIVKLIGTGDNLKQYATSLLSLAKDGNAKAIEVINKGIEEDLLKIDATNRDGETFEITLKL